MRTEPLVLVASSTWWPLSARMAMALMKSNCRVVTLCPPGSPLRAVRGIERHRRYNGLRSLSALRTAMLRERPEFVVPCDDGVVWQMQHLHRTTPELRPLIERSLGSSDGFAVVRDRASLLELAVDLGIRTPRTVRVETEADVVTSGMAKRGVLKRSGTWGGNGVEVVVSEETALSAFRRLNAPVKASFAWKRLLVNREPLALWMWNSQETPEVTIQQFVSGRPANAMLFCWEGRVVAMVSVEVLRAQGMTGAATVVRTIENREMTQAAEKIGARLGLSGFYGLDFMLENGTEDSYLIEMNPRCTQLGHLNLHAGGSLAEALASKLTGVAVASVGSPIQREIVFFPQAVKLNPKNPYLTRGFHDVPWEETELVRSLLEEGWAERKPLARIYHSLRPPTEVKETAFEPVKPMRDVRGGSGPR